MKIVIQPRNPKIRVVVVMIHSHKTKELVVAVLVVD